MSGISNGLLAQFAAMFDSIVVAETPSYRCRKFFCARLQELGIPPLVAETLSLKMDVEISDQAMAANESDLMSVLISMAACTVRMRDQIRWDFPEASALEGLDEPILAMASNFSLKFG